MVYYILDILHSGIATRPPRRTFMLICVTHVPGVCISFTYNIALYYILPSLHEVLRMIPNQLKMQYSVVHYYTWYSLIPKICTSHLLEYVKVYV